MEESEQHPPLEKFTFSVAAGRDAGKDLDMQITAMKNRVSSISNKVEIQGMPIMQSILGLTHDEHELTVLGKALLRVAPLMPQLDALQSRKRLIEMAVNDPQAVAAIFADFSQDVEDITNSVEGDE